MTRTRLYRHGNLLSEGFPVEQISERLAEADDTVVWLDLCGPTEDDFAMVREEFGLHVLAVEDALLPHERPKLDRYESHLFLSAYAVGLDGSTGEIMTSEVAAFVTHRALITVRKDERFDIDQLTARWDDNADLAKFGVAFLLHGLLDYLVDGHFATVQELDSAIEDLEDLLFEENRSNIVAVQRRTYRLRKSLVLLRRVVLPMREVVNTLMRPTTHVIDDAMLPYYQDVYDHVLRATEWTESLRDLVTTVLETNLTVQGNRMNLIMKKVTSWAAIIAVPTAVTGFYGQNVPYPGFGQMSGFIASTAVTAVLAGALYIVFRRKDWL
ncbi:magnesium transporter CorA family protein [Krasilnikovia sp. M28-CT-15]|uniref:magnesium transporter CorA family protein n=1 Tax=Krasilnikovia sp. M28-CT-15 TaxID=3373540 RepID=UPI0038762A70